MATATNYKIIVGQPAYDRIHFATMALESGARRLGITPLAMYRRLKQQDLIHQRLLRHYDMLHTQSLDYVAEDIAETLKNWELSEQREQSQACLSYAESRRSSRNSNCLSYAESREKKSETQLQQP